MTGIPLSYRVIHTALTWACSFLATFVTFFLIVGLPLLFIASIGLGYITLIVLAVSIISSLGYWLLGIGFWFWIKFGI
jgi:hypothetical protein